MKISFPYMGTSHIGLKYLFERLDFEVVMPNKPTEKTLSLGVRYAPEFACIPFKVLMGSYIESIEKGAEVLVSSGGLGPCRAGYYGMLHRRILEEAGYNCDLRIIDQPFGDLNNFMKNVLFFKPKNLSWKVFLKEINNSWLKLKTLDKLERYTNEVRPFEINKGDTTLAFNKSIQIVDEAKDREEILEAEKVAFNELQEVNVDLSRRPYKIGIIGEIYVVIEPFMNLNIERMLGEMGVLVDRSIYLTEWTRHNVWDRKGEQHVIDAAKPYLKQMIGGHGINSIGETVLYAKNGFDGVIQLAPFTCIPEIVASSILKKVSHDFNIPVLNINIDEQTGKSGVQTRIEAFLDLLRQKRQYMEDEITNENVSGC